MFVINVQQIVKFVVDPILASVLNVNLNDLDNLLLINV